MGRPTQYVKFFLLNKYQDIPFGPGGSLGRFRVLLQSSADITTKKIESKPAFVIAHNLVIQISKPSSLERSELEGKTFEGFGRDTALTRPLLPSKVTTIFINNVQTLEVGSRLSAAYIPKLDLPLPSRFVRITMFNLKTLVSKCSRSKKKAFDREMTI